MDLQRPKPESVTESALSFLAVSDETLFNNAADFWNRFLEGIEIRMPDPLGRKPARDPAHAAMCMNGKPTTLARYSGPFISTGFWPVTNSGCAASSPRFEKREHDSLLPNCAGAALGGRLHAGLR